MNPESNTFTTQQIAKWAELDAIDDAICDLYSGQDTHLVFELTEPQRNLLRSYLGDILLSLREWRVKYSEGFSDDVAHAVRVITEMQKDEK
jgi:hypothetical protein